MSEILKLIKEDLFTAMKQEVLYRKEGITNMACITQKNVSRAIISMFPEIGKKPSEGTDDDALKLVKKYISQQKERQLYIDKHLTETDVSGINANQLKKLVGTKMQELGDKLTSPEIQIAQKYLPKQASEEDVAAWIKENINFSEFKNKMQAMGPIMKQLKGADGNFIKSILLKL